MIGLDRYSEETLEKKELEKKLLTLVIPNEIFTRYKTEAENRFYKALKTWKEFKNL